LLLFLLLLEDPAGKLAPTAVDFGATRKAGAKEDEESKKMLAALRPG
jgi:hypothetical protein